MTMIMVVMMLVMLTVIDQLDDDACLD